MERDSIGEIPALAPAHSGPSPEERRIVALCLSILGVLSSGAMLGVAFSLYLVNHYPLLLIALSPLGRHLVLVAPTVHPAAFVVVAVGRHIHTCRILAQKQPPNLPNWHGESMKYCLRTISRKNSARIDR